MPPDGVPLPSVGRAMHAQAARSANDLTEWTGEFEADHTDPAIDRLMRAAPSNGFRAGRKAGGAACRLYGEQAEKAGTSVQWLDDSPTLTIGSHDVICTDGVNANTKDPKVFVIRVMPAHSKG